MALVATALCGYNFSACARQAEIPLGEACPMYFSLLSSLFPRSLIVAALGAGLMLSGCSISYSIGKSSDSVKSISESSSPAEKSDLTKAAYRSDLSNYTVVSVQSAQPAADYLRGVTRIAEKHGITDWEHDRASYLAIGSGLHQAGVAAGEVRRLSLVQALGSQEPDTMAAILEGYQS